MWTNLFRLLSLARDTSSWATLVQSLGWPMRTVAVWAQTQERMGSLLAMGGRERSESKKSCYFHVSNRRFEKVRDLSKIGGGGDREHLAEYVAGHARGSWPRQQRFGVRSDYGAERSIWPKRGRSKKTQREVSGQGSFFFFLLQVRFGFFNKTRPD